MQKLLPTFALLLLIWCQPIIAQDMVAIYALALEQDAELLIAEADYLAAIEAVPLARSERRPQIFFSAGASIRESDNSRLGDGTRESVDYSVSLIQSLYDTEIAASIDAAEASAAAELAQLLAARDNLILRVAETYFDILAAQDEVEFAYAERTSIARQLEQAQKRFEVGLIAITDVHEAQARFDSAEAAAILAENLLENAYQALAVITGDTTIRGLARVGETLKLALPDPVDAEDWVVYSLKNNRDLIAARENLNAARFVRDKSDRNQYPTIDLTASYTDTDVDDEVLGDSREDDVTVAVELEVPLFTGGRISAERAQAESAYRAAQNSVLLQTRLASQQLRTAYLDIVSGISQVNALKQALASSNIALEATQAGFDVGTRTSVDVLVSLRETYRARRDYARSRYDYLINSLRLKQAAGILNEDDLFDINRWLVQQ